MIFCVIKLFLSGCSYRGFENDHGLFPFAAKPLWALILEQFDDLLVKILLLAAIISFVSSIFFT